jgi:GAF domain-containing protein
VEHRRPACASGEAGPTQYSGGLRPLAACETKARTSRISQLPALTPARYDVHVTTELQKQVAARFDAAIGSGRRLLDRDPEYRALKKLAERNRKEPPKTPLDALQHIVDVARELTDGTFGALAITGETDYVEGFVVSGMDADELARLKGPPQGHGPLGTMRQDGLPVRLEDVSLHAKAFGFPPKHPEMKELLGLPIFAGPTVRGALYVTDRKRGGAFNEDDEHVLKALAHHAGLIIDSSWY